METRMIAIDIVIINSISVNPRTRAIPGPLPFRVWRSIGCPFRGLAVNVEHILATPPRGFRVVLRAALAPVSGVCKRVLRNTAQETDLLVARSLHAFHQLVQGLRVVLRTLF